MTGDGAQRKSCTTRKLIFEHRWWGDVSKEEARSCIEEILQVGQGRLSSGKYCELLTGTRRKTRHANAAN